MATYNNIKKIKIGDNIFNLYDSGNSGGTITSVKTTAGAHTTINVTSGAANFNVPTKTSHLTNDSGFLTAHQSLAGYVPTSRTINSKALTGNISLTYGDVGALPTRPTSIEFQPSSASVNNGGWLDFHYNQSTADYTSRIIEAASGTLTCYAHWTTAGLLRSTSHSNTVTIGSQNASFCHIYNSQSIPFIFNNTIATTSGDLGTTTYPWSNIFLSSELVWKGSEARIDVNMINTSASVGIQIQSTPLGSGGSNAGGGSNSGGGGGGTTAPQDFASIYASKTDLSQWMQIGYGRFGQNSAGTVGIYDDSFSSWVIYLGTNEHIVMPKVGSSTNTGSANCRVTEGGTFYRSTSSSERYKTNIIDITNAEALYNLPVHEFKYKDGYIPEDDTRYDNFIPGFIAEEVEQIYPIAVEYSESADFSGDETEDEVAEMDYKVGQVEDWNVRYIVPPMLKLIQNQKKEIDELKTEINELKQLLLPKEEDENIN